MKRQAYFDIAFIYRPAIFKKKPIYLKYSKKKSTDGNPKIGKNYIPKKKMRKFPFVKIIQWSHIQTIPGMIL